VGNRLHAGSGKIGQQEMKVPQGWTNANSNQVGCMMIRQITQINWRYIGDVLPSFVVMTFIPFSYSVAYGLIA
jgi:AGZA family xanthine/uracil permease-like MFS transporter